MSRVGSAVVFGCGVVGCISGAASGGRYSIALAVPGACVGLALGIIGYFGVVFPYVGWLIWYERMYHPTPMEKPPRLWAMLFLTAMIATLLLAAFVPWIVVGYWIRSARPNEVQHTDGGGITVFQRSTSHQPPRQVNGSLARKEV
jgi:hypothetical protein